MGINMGNFIYPLVPPVLFKIFLTKFFASFREFRYNSIEIEKWKILVGINMGNSIYPLVPPVLCKIFPPVFFAFFTQNAILQAKNAVIFECVKELNMIIK